LVLQISESEDKSMSVIKRDDSEFEEIRHLELRLLDPKVRASPDEISRLLADDFMEFGSSGHVYDKQGIINGLQDETNIFYELSNFQVKPLAPGLVLATYRTTRYRAGRERFRSSLRSSIWRKEERSWQMVFHQGTLVDN
jgi:hypothetical protein